MENYTSFNLLGFVLLCNVSAASAQALQFYPSLPVPGEPITFSYDLAKGPLQGTENLEVVVYQLNFNQEPVAQEVIFDGNRHGVFEGDMQVADNTKALFVRVFDAESGEEDNNNNRGYYTFFYEEGTARPISIAQITLAQALYTHAKEELLGIPANAEGAMKLLKGVLANDPELLRDNQFLPLFADISLALNDQGALKQLREQLKIFAAEETTSEEVAIMVRHLLLQVGEQNRASSLSKRLLKQFPKGKLAYQLALEDFNRRDNFDDKEAAYEDLVDDFFSGDLSEDDHAELHRLAELMARSCDLEQLDVFWYYQNLVDQERIESGNAYRESDFAWTLNQMAVKLAGKELEHTAPDLSAANNVSRQSLQVIRDIINKATYTKPASKTLRQYLQGLHKEYAKYADTHAMILYKMEEFEDALRYQEIALEHIHNDPSMLEKKAAYLEKVEGPTAAKAFIEGLIKEGYFSDRLNRQLKAIFMDEMDEAYETYLKSLKQLKTGRLEERRANSNHVTRKNY